MKCIDEEIPFEIPQGWEWCRIKHLFSMQAGKNIKAFELSIIPTSSHTYPCYGGNGLRGYVNRYNTEGNFILVGRQGALCGNVKEAKGKFYATEHAVVTDGYGLTHLHWAYYFMWAIDLNQYATATAQPGLAVSNIIEVLIPLPPHEEQIRIASKIDDTIQYIESFAKAQNELEALNNEVIINLRKSILQKAIQGKLVPQIAEEGTAQELLEQIQQEKQRLVKEGKLKRSVLTDSVIYKGDDNKYYERINKEVGEVELPCDYPNSWRVVRLKDVCQLIDGVKMNGKGICLDAKYLRGKSSPTYLDKGRFVRANDNIILVDGENSGEIFTVPVDGYMGSTFKQLWLSTAMYKPYLLTFILFYKEALRNSKRGAAIPHLNKDLFYNLPIGIPPCQEQERIAQRIDALFQLLK